MDDRGETRVSLVHLIIKTRGACMLEADAMTLFALNGNFLTLSVPMFKRTYTKINCALISLMLCLTPHQIVPDPWKSAVFCCRMFHLSGLNGRRRRVCVVDSFTPASYGLGIKYIFSFHPPTVWLIECAGRDCILTKEQRI